MPHIPQKTNLQNIYSFDCNGTERNTYTHHQARNLKYSFIVKVKLDKEGTAPCSRNPSLKTSFVSFS